jgi:hypothetical protein
MMLGMMSSKVRCGLEDNSPLLVAHSESAESGGEMSNDVGRLAGESIHVKSDLRLEIGFVGTCLLLSQKHANHQALRVPLALAAAARFLTLAHPGRSHVAVMMIIGAPSASACAFRWQGCTGWLDLES